MIASLCRRYGVVRLDVFGSLLGADFDPLRSDVDLVIEFDPATPGSPLHRYFDLKQELERLFKRPVDLVELNAMPDTRLKRSIARSKVPLFAATT
jgi:predicted nucleotidyltransferase